MLDHQAEPSAEELIALSGFRAKTADAEHLEQQIGIGDMTQSAMSEKCLDRLAQRHGYRDRIWHTRAGTIELVQP